MIKSDPSIFRNLVTDYQGGQFPPTHAPPIVDFHCRRYRSYLVNLSQFSWTTSSRQFFPMILKRLTRDKECSQMWIHMSRVFVYILKLRTWLIFLFHSNCTRGGVENIMWLIMMEEVLSIFYSRDTIIWLMFCFLISKTGPYFQWNIDMYGGRSPI